MTTSNSVRAGFLEATAEEIRILRDMGTWDSEDVLEEDQMKASKIGRSR